LRRFLPAGLLAALASLALLAGSAGGYATGEWPQANYRPFAATSPFNVPVPANPRLASNSASIVANMMAGGAPNPINPAGTFYKPTYWPQATDPVYTLRTGGYQHDGETLRAPQGLREASGSDHHLTVVEPDGTHWGFWNALVDNANHVIKGNSTNAGKLTARKDSIGGSGVGCTNSGTNGAVAAGFCTYAGLIRAQELKACVINHALFIATSKTSGGYVYPAVNADGGGGLVPEGARVQLDPTLDIAGYPCWKRAVLGAFQKYGAYVGDTAGAASFGFGVEDDVMYTSLINPRTGVPYQGRLALLAQQYGVSSFTFSDVPWASRLRVIDPCVTQQTC
jgi:hypothetical protein